MVPLASFFHYPFSTFAQASLSSVLGSLPDEVNKTLISEVSLNVLPCGGGGSFPLTLNSRHGSITRSLSESSGLQI